MMPERQLKILRKRLFVVTIIFSVAVIASFVLAVYSFYSAHSAASHDRLTICRAQNNSDKALARGVAASGEARTEDAQSSSA
jgi:hypothetical protein